MFRISTKGSYGLRAVLDIAMNYEGKPVPLKEIAERQEISEGYLEQLMTVLRRAGIVRSVRGQHGGYVLARKPSEILVGEIIRILEGPIAPMDCVEEQDGIVGKCNQVPDCVIRMVWVRIRDRIQEVVDSITIEDLRKDKEALNIRKQDFEKKSKK